MRPDESPPPALIPPGPKLTLKPRGPDVGPPVERLKEEARATHKFRKKKKQVKAGKPKSALLQSVGAFLLIGGLFGGLLYHQVTGKELISPEHAHYGRVFFVVAFYLVLVIEAFTEDMLHGLFCVFFPPYALVYGLLYSDAGPLRGLSLAVIVFLGAEVYFTPEDALVIHVRDGISEFVSEGQRLIQDEPRNVPRH
ncbi:MAG: hypothetical protein JJU05_07650 [Verrucomicrobia bacterium]|nr:hypothetical protein [Verrucomicrobiota bacterium]MCH8528740.1 hypothetical protein [Kiritimatiellia bacterium]